MSVDYIEIFGAKDGSRFALLLERRPKWLLLLLLLRKKIKLSFAEAIRELGMNYSSFSRALRYLAGVVPNKRKVGYITSLTTEPLVAIEALSYNEKYAVLTEHGRRFAEKIITYLKDVALRYGKIDVEEELGIPKINVLTEIRKTIPDLKIEKYENRIISMDKVVKALSVTNPRLIVLMKPELIDAYPVKIVTTRKTHLVYVIL